LSALDDLKKRLIQVRINRVDEENRVMGSVIDMASARIWGFAFFN
jgi:hypothetical protein